MSMTSRPRALFNALLLLTVVGAPAARPAGPPATGHGVALLELFTSEGCSSCPPADALLARLADETGHGPGDVFVLAYHVDYWDPLGWRDRFASPAFTRRQETYARRFGLAGPYTPQMVVNGERQFVGSDATTAQDAIRDGLARRDALPVSLAARVAGGEVTVDFAAPGAPPGSVLEVAWVDDRATSSPDRGENDGRTLHHVHIVRELRGVTIERHTSGRVTLHPPDAVPGRVIAWLQQGDAGRVLGAAASTPLAR